MIGAVRRAFSRVFCFSKMAWIMERAGSWKAIILVYHRVLDKKESLGFDESVISTTPDNFEKQMGFLAKNYNVISLEEYVGLCRDKKKIPRNSVIITFDDGYKDNYLNAFPILKRYRLPACVFLVAGAINRKEIFWWDRVAYAVNKTNLKKANIEGLGVFDLGDKQEKARAIRRICLKLKGEGEARKKEWIRGLEECLKVRLAEKKIADRVLLSWKEAGEMARNRISFGSHTLTHPVLASIPLSEAEREIADSKKEIEKRLGKRSYCFSYPNGYKADYNEKIKAAVKRAGFGCAMTYIPGKNGGSPDLFELRRIPIEYDDDMCAFRSKVAGAEIVPARVYLGLARLFGRKRI